MNSRSRLSNPAMRILIVVGLLAAAAAVILATSGTAPRAVAGPQTDAQQRAAFETLGRRSSSRSALPEEVRTAAQVAADRFPVNANEVRDTQADGETQFWLVPGEGHICMIADNADGIGMTCNTTTAAQRGTTAIFERSTTGDVDVIFGLVPDTVDTVLVRDSEGDIVDRAQPSSNVYVLRGRDLSELSARSGTKIISSTRLSQ